MRYEELIERVRERAALATPAEAERAVAATLGVLGGCLTRGERAMLAGDLPPRAAWALALAGGFAGFAGLGGLAGEVDLAQLYRRVGEREGVAPSFAAEHAQVVCQEIARAVSPETLALLRRHLPEELAGLLAVPPVDAPPPPPGEGIETIRRRSTLAEGRPGSLHPVSEAAPSPGQTGSVVRAPNPHAGTKLSSSPGYAHERRGDTLATGEPGASRPPSDG